MELLSPYHLPKGMMAQAVILFLVLLEGFAAGKDHHDPTRGLQVDDANTLESFFEAHYVTSFMQDATGDLILSDEDFLQIESAALSFEIAYNTLIQGFENPDSIRVEEVELISVSGLPFEEIPYDSEDNSDGGYVNTDVGTQGRRRQQSSIRSFFPNVRSVFRVRGSCNGCGGRFASFTDQVSRRMQRRKVVGISGSNEDAPLSHMNNKEVFSSVRFLEEEVATENQNVAGADTDLALAPGIPTELQVLAAYSSLIRSLDLADILDVVFLDEFDSLGPDGLSPSQQPPADPSQQPPTDPSQQPPAASPEQPFPGSSQQPFPGSSQQPSPGAPEQQPSPGAPEQQPVQEPSQPSSISDKSSKKQKGRRGKGGSNGIRKSAKSEKRPKSDKESKASKGSKGSKGAKGGKAKKGSKGQPMMHKKEHDKERPGGKLRAQNANRW